jgi:4'-phosphopantetheinyl transferase superfamily
VKNRDRHSAELALVQPDDAQTRQQVLAELVGHRGIADFQIRHDDLGKPHLDISQAVSLSYNFTHGRGEAHSFGVIGLSDGPAIGVDCAVWTEGIFDRDFWASIAAPEDAGLVERLGGKTHDSAVALWVIKEAALKCVGDVMIDPRHISVSSTGGGGFQIGTSSLGRKPLPHIYVQLFVLRPQNVGYARFLIGVASLTEFSILPFHGKPWTIETLATAR